MSGEEERVEWDRFEDDERVRVLHVTCFPCAPLPVSSIHSWGHETITGKICDWGRDCENFLKMRALNNGPKWWEPFILKTFI